MDEDNPSNLPSPVNFKSKSLFDPIIEEFSHDGDITLYDMVMSNIDPEELSRLKKRKNLSVAGMTFTGGGIFDKLSMAGRGSASEDVITKKLSVAGSSNFRGRLAVAEKASFAGKFTIQGDALFKGKVSIAGAGSIHKNMVTSGKTSISGRVTVNDYILADGRISVAGHLSTHGIRSTETLSLSGKLWVGSDLIARIVELNKMSGQILGNMYAEEIKDISKHDDSPMKRDLSNLTGVLQYVAYTLRDIFTGKRNRGLYVTGDIIADEVDLNNIIVEGNVYGKNIKIGNDTKILGTIYYTENLELPAGKDESDYLIEKGFPEKIEPSIKSKELDQND